MPSTGPTSGGTPELLTSDETLTRREVGRRENGGPIFYYSKREDCATY